VAARKQVTAAVIKIDISLYLQHTNHRWFGRFFCFTITFCARELDHRSGSVTLINYYFSIICLGIDWERIFLSYTFFHI